MPMDAPPQPHLKILLEIEKVQQECRSLNTELFQETDYTKPMAEEEGRHVKERFFDFLLDLQKLAYMLEVGDPCRT